MVLTSYPPSVAEQYIRTSFVFIGTIIGITSALAVMLSHWPLKILEVCFMASIYRYMEQTTRWGTKTSAASRKLLFNLFEYTFSSICEKRLDCLTSESDCLRAEKQ